MKINSVLQFGLRLTMALLIPSLLGAAPQQTSENASATARESQQRTASGNANARESLPRAGVVLAANAGSSLFFLGKSTTRARIARARAAERAEAAAAARERTNQLQKAQVGTTNNPPSAPTSTSVVRPNNSSPGAVVAPPVVPIQLMPRSTIATNAPLKLDRAQETLDSGPRVQPVSEATGPLFDDKDPLLGYQRDQAARGNPESEYAMGMRYLTGTGLEQDDKLAREWLEKASTHGNLRARAKLRELDNHHEF